MKINYYIIILFAFSVIFSSCEKKQIEKNAKSISGTWRIKEFNYDYTYEYNVPGDPVKKANTIKVQDYTNLIDDIHTIEFFEYKNAYTAALKGVYKIDYADANLKDAVDTFYYTINQTEMSVIDIASTTKTLNALPGRPRIPIFVLLPYRYKFEKANGNAFTFDATPFRNNETFFIKTEKIN